MSFPGEERQEKHSDRKRPCTQESIREQDALGKLELGISELI